MKVEKTDVPPKFNLLKPDGERQQVHSEQVSDVLLNDGKWYTIIEGSFKFYKTSSTGVGAGVPFVQFDTVLQSYDGVPSRKKRRVEVFPASVCGIAYVPAEDDSEAAS